MKINVNVVCRQRSTEIQINGKCILNFDITKQTVSVVFYDEITYICVMPINSKPYMYVMDNDMDVNEMVNNINNLFDCEILELNQQKSNIEYFGAYEPIFK